MESVMISIRPKWCELIANGKKIIEVRKSTPKLDTPFKCYIYETKARSDIPTFVDEDGHVIYTGRGQVIGEFVCDKVKDFSQWEYDYGALLRHIDLYAGTNGDYRFLHEYLKGKKRGYGWHISDLKIYDKPKELHEFVTVDKEAIRQCKHRSQSYYSFTTTGYIKNGFICNEKDDWCFGCKRKPLYRPPQSWCYVEGLS